MSCNFHDTAGLVFGYDKHWFFVIGPWGIPVPVDAPHWFVNGNFWLSNGKRTPRVTSDGFKMMQRGFKIMLIPHMPVPPGPPHPFEAVWYGVIVAKSGSEPMLSIGSVTGQGRALQACMYWMFSLYRDCGGFGVGLNLNTVKTTPSVADLFKALRALIPGFMRGWVESWGVSKWLVGQTEPLEDIRVRVPSPELAAERATKHALRNAVRGVKGAVGLSPSPAALAQATLRLAG